MIPKYDDLSAEGIALYAHRVNVLVTAETARAIAAICQAIERG